MNEHSRPTTPEELAAYLQDKLQRALSAGDREGAKLLMGVYTVAFEQWPEAFGADGTEEAEEGLQR